MILQRNIFLFVTLLLPFISNAGINLDSLKGIWNDTNQKTEDRFLAAKTIAWTGYLQSYPDSSFYFSEQYFLVAKERNNLKEMATALYIQANACGNQGLNVLALEKAKSSLAIYEKIPYKTGVANSYNLIGNICLSLKEFNEAQKYYSNALEIYLEKEDKMGQANVYNNMGNILKEESNYLDALNYYLKSLKLKKAIGNKIGISSTYTNIGLVQLAMKDYLQALEYLELGLNICEEEGFENGESSCLINISECYFKQGEVSMAEDFAEKGLSLSIKIKSLEATKAAYEILYRISKNTGNFPKALKMKELFELCKDSLRKEEVVQNLQQMKLQEEYKLKKQADLFLYELEIANNEKKLLKEKTFRNSLYFLIAVIAIFLLGFVNRYVKIKRHKRIIEEQHLELNEAHGELTDSINYAKWIQSALLKTDERITAHLPAHFIYYSPKDIVSGDFYWFHEKGGYLYFCVADCTGHGVPGAFMSMLGISFLQEIVAMGDAPMPSEIMEGLSERLVQELSQKEGDNPLKDGMDASIIRYHKESEKIDWCGANNSIYIASNNDYTEYLKKEEIRVIKIDGKEGVLNELLPMRQSVGYNVFKTPFVDCSLTLEKGDLLYLLTDGYADQFGGLKGKKYMQTRLKHFLLENWKCSIKDQHKKLEMEFINWKGNMGQIDDVCIAGFVI